VHNKEHCLPALGNPAAVFLDGDQDDEDNFRFGILGPLSVGVEMGDIKRLGDRAEEIEGYY